MHGVESQIVIAFAKLYHNANVTPISKTLLALALLTQNVVEQKSLMYQAVNVNAQAFRLVIAERNGMIRHVVVLLIQLQLVNRVTIIGKENQHAIVFAIPFQIVNATLHSETQPVIVVLIQHAQLVKPTTLLFVNANAIKFKLVIVD
jgi:hypothetical protein